MANPFVGEIRFFAGTFAPHNFSFCNGALLTIEQYGALFSLIGTTYGGNGQETFGLPDFRGRLPVHWGTGIGLTTRVMGQAYGSETVTLSLSQLPSHTHRLQASPDAGTSPDPGGNILAAADTLYDEPGTSITLQNFSPQAVRSTGGSQPHSNMMPYMAINFIIALTGIYPSRN